MTKADLLSAFLFDKHMRCLYLFFFRLYGWKIKGDVPRDINKFIIAAAPHSSNLDFLIGLAVRSILRFKSNFLGKEELFRPPFGWLFRKLGGFPVDRSGRHGLVEQVVSICRNNERFVLAIAPEGTRKMVTKWKSGFYHIAHAAGIPIVFCSIDYLDKTVQFYPPFHPSGDFLKDASNFSLYFKGKHGKNRGVAPVI